MNSALTDPSAVRIRPRKFNRTRKEQCSAELIYPYPIPHASECLLIDSSDKIKFPCDELQCGCQYQYDLRLNQSNLVALCAHEDCDFQFHHSNFTRIPFQTRNKRDCSISSIIFLCLALPRISNFRLKSSSSSLKRIEVTYDYPFGCFDQVVLVCETVSMKLRRSFINATVCDDLLTDEHYRIYVETRRNGWEPTRSNILQTRLSSTAEIISQSNQSKIYAHVYGSFLISLLLSPRSLSAPIDPCALSDRNIAHSHCSDSTNCVLLPN